MALTKVTGGLISTTSDYKINNIVGVAGTFTTLNVSGVLTYEDVTNIESVGVSTFKDDVEFHGTGAGISSAFWDKSANEFKFKDGVKLSFGDSQDLSIYHDGSYSYIKDSGTGDLVLQGTNNVWLQHGNGENALKATQDAGVEIRFNNLPKISTIGYGATVFGTTETQKLNVTGISTFAGDMSIADKILHTGDTNTAIRFPGNDTVTVETAGSERLKITSAGRVGVGTITPHTSYRVDIRHTSDSILHLGQNNNTLAGMGNDSWNAVAFQGTNCELGLYKDSSGDFSYIMGTYQGSTDIPIVFRTGNRAERLRITPTGNVGINASAASNRVEIIQDPKGFPSDSAQPNATILIKHGTSGTSRRWVGIGASLTGAWLQSSSPGGTGLAAPFWINKGGGDIALGSGGERLFVKHSGTQGVGVGTDNPKARLDVVENSASGYIASFRQRHTSNSAQVFIDSPTDNNLRPTYIDLAQAGTVKWSIGQVYQSTSDRAFHICSGSNSQTNSKFVLTTAGKIGIGTYSPDGTLEVVGSIFVTSQGSSQNSGIWWSDPDNRSEVFAALMESDNTFRFKTAGGSWKDTIYIQGGGRIGIGTISPSTADVNGSVDIVSNYASSPSPFRVINKHSVYGGGIQMKCNNARGGLEFLNASGSNSMSIYHSTGGWHWGSTLNIPHGSYLRIGKNSGSYLLDVDSQSSDDGHIIAAFNGAESSNHAGLMIAHYLCGSDDNRTGLYWEHQNVSNQRMWMGDDLRLYLKSSDPTESTAQGRYLMTVEGGTADFPDGSSYDNAAKSALEIKKHHPNSQSGNYWIFDHNNVPRQIHCDMDVDGGGWMLWNEYNMSSLTSMNEALGGSSTSPHSGLSRSNWGNYSKYQVLIRASDIDSNGERLHSIVQLDANGALLRCADYGADFFLEDVGDQFQPNLTHYFNSATGEYIKIDGAYQPQLGASSWQTFSNGGWQVVYIREMDSRMAPGMHRTYAMVDRVYGFDTNGVPVWYQTNDMSPLPFFGDIILSSEVADGTNAFMSENGRRLTADNGNNGPYAMGRMRGVFTGQFECEFKLGYSWGWSQAIAMSTIQMEALHKEPSGNPYNAFATNKGQLVNSGNSYAYFGIRNNSSNNLWDVFMSSTFNGSQTISTNSGGAAFSVGHVIWRESDGTIKARRKDGTHGTKTMSHKFAGPLVFVSGQQSVMDTEWVSCWDAKDDGTHVGSRTRYGI